MSTLIRGKVARVLNEREVAINVGSAKGVVVGMYFDVIEDEEIRDPDTREVLGSIDRPKVGLQVTHVQEKLSVAMTRTWSLKLPKWITEYETLKKEWVDLDENDSRVKVGDPVVQVIEERVEQEKANS